MKKNGRLRTQVPFGMDFRKSWPTLRWCFLCSGMFRNEDVFTKFQMSANRELAGEKHSEEVLVSSSLLIYFSSAYFSCQDNSQGFELLQTPLVQFFCASCVLCESTSPICRSRCKSASLLWMPRILPGKKLFVF